MILSNSDDAAWWPVIVTRLPVEDKYLYDWIVYTRHGAVRMHFGVSIGSWKWSSRL